MAVHGTPHHDQRMTTTDPIDRHAAELLETAQLPQSAALEPGCHAAVPEVLVSLEEALQVLSAACYQLAADAASENTPTDRFSRELDVELVGALHDVAAGFARCAHACRRGRSAVAPIIAQRLQRHERRGQRVA